MASSAQTGSTNDRAFRVFLFEIALEITTDLLDSLKYLCKDDLPKGKLGSIKTAREFLDVLWEGGKIWPGDLNYLTTLLETAQNIQLANWIRAKEPPRKSNLPRQTSHFIGRDTVVNEIARKLSTGSSHMVILIALPGMGKTEVAIRVGHLLQNEKWPVLYVERQVNLVDVCHEILYLLTNRRWTTSDSNTVSHALRKLSELTDDHFIILDNTENIQGDAFDNFIRSLVRCAPKVRVIITTQQDVGFVLAGDVHKIRLDPLDPASSAELLTKLAPNAKNYAKELGELCGGIPLFLNCASSLMADGFNPKVFTQELRQNPSRVLRDSEHLTMFYLYMGRYFLHKFPEQVLRNLVSLSVFPSSFSMGDIQFLFNDEYELETVKTKLIQCCLLQRISDDLFEVHRLIQTYCREERASLNLVDVGRAADHKFNHHFLELLRSLHKEFIAKNSSSSAIISFRKNKPNIMEALKNCLDDNSEAKEKEFAVDVANEVVDFLAKILAPPMECTTVYQKCCQIARHSADEKRLADSLNSIGFRRLEDLAHGKDDATTLQIFQEAYEIRKTLPEEAQKCEKHAHTTTKLGLCVLLQGEVERGRQLIHEGIALRKELEVPLYVAAGYCDLGHSYRHCGEYHTAVQIWQTETLPIYKECLGDHPWTASILQHIAFAYMALAKEDPTNYADQAEKYTKEALELRERLLGVHQDTARSHVHLSLVYIIREKWHSALTELEKALEIQEDVVGVQQDTIDTLNFMTDVLTRLGRREEAEERKEQVRNYCRTLEARPKCDVCRLEKQ